jgi:hypothetical protein
MLVSRTDTVRAVRDVVARHCGVSVPDYVAERVVEAVMACADGVATVQASCSRQEWADEHFRGHVRIRMRRDLLAQVADAGRIPTAIPTETLKYRDWNQPSTGFDGTPVPADAVEHGADWTHLVVTLTVPVRTPSVDRTAAVKAGLL